MNVDRIVLAFAGSMILASLLLAHYLSPSWLWLTGFVGANMVPILAVPYFFVGLSIVHCYARPSSQRTLWLTLFYVVLIMFGFLAMLLVTGLGFAETWLGLRRRKAGGVAWRAGSGSRNSSGGGTGWAASSTRSAAPMDVTFGKARTSGRARVTTPPKGHAVDTHADAMPSRSMGPRLRMATSTVLGRPPRAAATASARLESSFAAAVAQAGSGIPAPGLGGPAEGAKAAKGPAVKMARGARRTRAITAARNGEKGAGRGMMGLLPLGWSHKVPHPRRRAMPPSPHLSEDGPWIRAKEPGRQHATQGPRSDL